VGTRFIASTECIAHATYKDIILQSPETGTDRLDRGRLRVRALHTPLVEKLLQSEQMEDYVFGGKAMEASWLKGDSDAGVLPAGQISGLIHNVLSVKEIIEEMVS
jgi:NAD(P)H-dependent flavin oxidoreductase YrpB (nitropropane dioxygenase family)